MSISNKYRIDNNYVEHGCCWDSAIVVDCEKGEGMYGHNVALVCECDSDNANVICAALNETLREKENNNGEHEPIKIHPGRCA